MQRFIRGIIVPALVIAAGRSASRTGVLQLEFLSRPSDILAAGIGGLRDGSILLATGQTFEAAAFGLAIAHCRRRSRRHDHRPVASYRADRRTDDRGAAADPRGRVHPADAAPVRLRPADGRHRRRLCLRLADPDRDHRGRARHRAAAARSGAGARALVRGAHAQDHSPGGAGRGSMSACGSRWASRSSSR